MLWVQQFYPGVYRAAIYCIFHIQEFTGGYHLPLGYRGLHGNYPARNHRTPEQEIGISLSRLLPRACLCGASRRLPVKIQRQ